MASSVLFLSYNTRDTEAVQRVRRHLEGRGVPAFIDQENLIVGINWFDALQRAIAEARGVVVFLGPDGLGRWQKREMAVALDHQTRDESFPVIPVVLPGVDKPEAYSSFLALNTFVDLRGGLDQSDLLVKIARAASGGTGSSPGAQAPDRPAICPYRALEPFREEDASLFFGRDAFVDDPECGLLIKVRSCPLVAVVGASGSGKSSVVQAGLLPRLRLEPPSRGTWDAVVVRPGDNGAEGRKGGPAYGLAWSLVSLWNPGGTVTGRLLEAEQLGAALAAGGVGFGVTLQKARESAQVDQLLLILDQFEELFTQVSEADRRPFVDRLLAEAAGARVTILITLRADYYGRTLELGRTLNDLIQRGIVNVGPMSRDELCEAIERPARHVGLEFAPGLVERLRDDVGDEPGNLPLLEFALTELWERREGHRLTHEAYEHLGQVVGAIGRRAETVYRGLASRHRSAVPRLFGRLVRLASSDEQGTDTRRRVRLADLDPSARAAAEPFIAGRLLVTRLEGRPDDLPADVSRPTPHDDTTIEVAHEALINSWEELKTWIGEDRQFLLWRQRLGDRIAAWIASGRDRSELVRGPSLAKAVRFARARRSDLNDAEAAYIAESEAQERRPRRQVVLLVTALVVLAGLTGIWGRATFMRVHLANNRLIVYERIREDLNRIYCFIQDVGTWKEETPGKILAHRRNAAESMQRNRLLWSPETYQACLDYMDAAFEDDGRGGRGVRIKTHSREKQAGIPGWNSNWDDQLTGRVDLDHNRRYNHLVDLIAKDLQVAEDFVLGGSRLIELRRLVHDDIKGDMARIRDFVEDEGTFAEETPHTVVGYKRKVDRLMHGYRAVWPRDTFRAYLDYMDKAAFLTYQKTGTDARIKTSPKAKRHAIAGWSPEWDSLLTGKVDPTHPAKYQELMNLFARDLGGAGR